MTHKEAAYFAERASVESPCQSKRGVVIWDSKGVISIGHNHQPYPFLCDGSDRCKQSCGKTAIHAEQHAILLAERSRLNGAQMLHVKTISGEIVANGRPSCMECSKLILEAGIAYMWLFHENGWRWYAASEFHRSTVGDMHMISLAPPAMGPKR